MTSTTPRVATGAAAGTAVPGGRHPQAWNAVATIVIWLTSLFVVALWVSGAGIQSLFAMNAETLNTIGRLTGLVSANLLLYQVLLMARVPLFERGFGRDAMIRLHRLAGFWSFWLLMLHIVFLVAGYAAQAGMNPLAQAWQFVWAYPGMLLATAGTALLILVVVTSMRRPRRRLRYESWHLLHLYGYLGVGLAIPHMLWTGADFITHPAAAAYWWALWALAAACVLVFRLAAPLWRSLRHDIRVASVTPDGQRGVVVRMRGRGLHRLHARAGQYFVWRFLDGAGWSAGHPFSLAAAPDGDEFVIAARLVGDGSQRLTRLSPGTRVLVEGPYGHMTGERRTGGKLLMLAAGAGIAPLVALLESEPYRPGDAVLVTRDRDELDRMRATEIDRLTLTRGVRHVTLNGPRGDEPRWFPATYAAWDGAELIRRIAPDLDECDVYVCGPAAWMAAVRADLARAGVPDERIHSEAFAV